MSQKLALPQRPTGFRRRLRKLGNMARIKDPEFSDSALDEEDEATLAAIEEGIKAADEGRLASEEKLREFIPQWISRCFTRKPR